MAEIKHSFQSNIADDPAANANGMVLPSHWNANHTFSANATEITFTAVGNIANTTVQQAIAELDAEKLALAGGTMAGALVAATPTVTVRQVRNIHSGTAAPSDTTGSVDGDLYFRHA